MTFAPHEIQWTGEKVQRLWDYYASQPAYHQQYFGAQAGAAVARFVGQHLDLPQARQILDLSCGRGDLIAAMLPRLQPGQRIVGTDPSTRSIETCRQRFAAAGAAVQLELTAGFATPLPSGGFDLVLATEVIEHLMPDEISALLAEAKRLLRPSGSLLITTPLEENLDGSKVLCPDCGCVFHRWQHQRSWTAGQLRDCLHQAGFRATLVQPIDWGGWQPDPGPVWKTWLRRALRRFRHAPPATGLVYLGQPEA